MSIAGYALKHAAPVPKRAGPDGVAFPLKLVGTTPLVPCAREVGLLHTNLSYGT